MRKTNLLLLGIFLLAAVLRFYQLGKNPPSIDWDEASLGYNAYSLLKTSKDEYGNRFPISIRSFNDYKPPLYTYVTVPSVAVFGLNEFAVRFPSALAGTLTVLITYFLVKEIFPRATKEKFGRLGLSLGEIASFLLAISPWHLQFSRVAFEANLSLTIFVLAVLILLLALRKGSTLYYIASAIFFVLTMYAYHSARLIIPLFLLLVAYFHKSTLLKQRLKVLVSITLGIILLIPLFVSVLRGSAQARFSTVSMFTNPGLFTQEKETTLRQLEYAQEDQNQMRLTKIFHHPLLVYSSFIAKGYLDHFDVRFLFLQGDEIGRHSAAGMGLLYFWELPFIVLGIYYLIKEKLAAKINILLSWLLVSPVPAAVSSQTPHAVRSLFMLPVLLIIEAYGIHLFLGLLKKYKYYKLLLSAVVIIVITNFYYYLNLYYIHTPYERSRDWQYGYRQLVERVAHYKSQVDDVVITTDYDQPHIFFLFYEKTDPHWYQKLSESGWRGFGKYSFRKIEYAQDSKVKKRLIVGSPKEIPNDAPVLETIEFLNGETAFILVKT